MTGLSGNEPSKGTDRPFDLLSHSPRPVHIHQIGSPPSWKRPPHCSSQERSCKRPRCPSLEVQHSNSSLLSGTPPWPWRCSPAWLQRQVDGAPGYECSGIMMYNSFPFSGGIGNCQDHGWGRDSPCHSPEGVVYGLDQPGPASPEAGDA